MPKYVEPEDESSFFRVAAYEEETATTECTVKRRESSKHKRRGFECVGIYVCSENFINTHETGRRTRHAVVSGWQGISILISVPRGCGGKGEMR